MADAVMDYTTSDKYQLQPFFKAGSCVPMEWIHRKEGKQISSALIIKDTLDTVDDSSQDYVVQSAGTSGIAGTQFYQAQAQILAFDK